MLSLIKRIVRRPAAFETFGPPILFRPGKWVFTRGRVGIITDIRQFPFAMVMLTDHEGLNDHEIKAHINDIRLARRSEIPESRRPSAEAAAARGYHN